MRRERARARITVAAVARRAEHLHLEAVHVVEEPPEGWAGETGLIDDELLRWRLPERFERLQHFHPRSAADDGRPQPSHRAVVVISALLVVAAAPFAVVR